MKVSQLQIKKLKRLDPEHYFYRHSNNKHTQQLSDIAEISVGKTPSIITEGKIPFYRVGDIRKFTLKNSKIKISRDSLPEKYIANVGDILLSTKGRVGDGVIVKVAGFYNQDLTRIRPHEIDSEILAIVLNNYSTQKTLSHFMSNQMHPFIRLSSLRNIPITLPSVQECTKIKHLYKKLVATQEKVDKIQNDIDSSFTSSEEERSKVLKSELLVAKRFDPEFFTKNKSAGIRFKDLNKISIRIGLYKKKFVTHGTPYLRSHNLDDLENITEFVKAQSHEISKKGEILLTRVGTTKAICITSEKFVPSDNFIRINVENPDIENEIICEYFNSQAGQRELSNYMQGSQQKRLNKKTLLDIPIPKMDPKIQIRLKKMIQEKEREIKEAKKIISILEQPMSQL